MYRIDKNYMLVTGNTNEHVNIGNIGNFYSEEKDLDTMVINRTINRIYNETNYPDFDNIETYTKSKFFKLYLRQNYALNGYGILLSIVGTETGKNYISQICNDFKSSEMLRFENSFWTSCMTFLMPDVKESLIVSVKEIKYSDIDGATITTFPSINEYESLVTDNVLPPTINVSVRLDDDLFVNILPYNQNINKTLTQELLEFWNLENSVVDLKIEHTVSYGLAENEETGDGFRSFTITNSVPTSPVIFGLDLREYGANQILIHVSTEFNVDGKKAYRSSSIIWDYSGFELVNPNQTVIYPVEVIENTEIIQTELITSSNYEIVEVIQPLYVEIQSTDIKYENKRISFDLQLSDTALIVNSDIIFSKPTSDGKYYFDLSELNKPSENSEFVIQSQIDGNIIHKGKFV